MAESLTRAIKPADQATAETPTASHHALDGALAHAVVWSGGVKLITQLLTWTSTFIVARLLTPEDYGLVGMAAVYLYLVQLLSELGIGTAVVTLRNLSEEQLAQMNTVSVLAGIAGFAISTICANSLGVFFNSPKLPGVVIAMSLAFVINSFRVVPGALLQRSLRFRRVALIDGTQAVVLAGANVAFAAAGFRYWTLVLGYLLSALISTTLMVRSMPCRFVQVQWKSISHAIAFSWRVVIGAVAGYVYTDADFIVAGKRLGEAALGAYNFGWTLANVPIEKITSLVGAVAPSIFSAAQHDRALMRRYLLLITEGIALATFPATLGLALVADDLVRVGLGDKWLGAIVPLRLIALYASVRSITPFLLHVLNVTGSTRYAMFVSIIAATVLPIAFYIGSFWGGAGIASAWIIAHPVVVALPIAARAFRSLDLSVSSYLKALWPAVASCLVMLAVTVGLEQLMAPIQSRLLVLSLLIPVGGLAYAASLFIFFRSRVVAIRQGLEFLRGSVGTNPFSEGESSGGVAVAQSVLGQPYFSTMPRPAASSSRRALLIAYNFPPDQTIGALRWQKMSRHLFEGGWDLDVVTLDPSQVSMDESRYADLPCGVRVFGVPTRPLAFQRAGATLAGVYRRAFLSHTTPAGDEEAASRDNGGHGRSWMRSALRAHRARKDYARMKQWAEDAAEVALKIVEPGVHHAVISSGPPHMAHEAARIVAKATGLPLVVDLRDPWSLNNIDRGLPEQLASPVWIRLAKFYERRIVSAASLGLANTEPFAGAMARAYPQAANRIVAVLNGADDDPIPPSHHGDVFRLRFAGSIYDVSSPSVLFRAAAKAVQRLRLTPNDLAIEFLVDEAHYEGIPINHVAAQTGLSEFTRVSPLRPRAEALEFLAGATMLVSLRQYSPLAIPAKLFEYVRVGAWLLVMAERDAATELLLRGSSAYLVPPGDVDATADAICAAYEAFRSGVRPRPLSMERDFSRRSQSARLITRLNALAEARPTP